jgi:hypothetical protein
MYLTQPTFRENLRFLILIFFAKKRLFQIKTAITFAYELGKNCVIYEKLSTQKVTSNFNDHKLFA